jgi:protein TonB
MFGTLVESNPRPARRRGVVAVSAAVHAAVTLLALWATAEGAGPSPRPAMMIPEEPLTPTFLPPVRNRDPGGGASPIAGPKLLAEPVPSVPTAPLLPAFSIPEALPPVELLLGDPFRGPHAGRRPRPDRVGTGGVHTAPPGILDAARADKAALPLESNVPPHYPDELRVAGIEGVVEVEFVIEASGRVRPGSLVVMRADHPRFSRAVGAAVMEYRYLPAELAGTPVAVRVRQRFAFTLRRIE